MASRFKITGFARFLLFLLVFAPLAYIGASYIQGEDGIQNVKDLIGIGDKSSTTSNTSSSSSEIDLEEAQEMIEDLKEELAEKEAEIKELRSQLEEANQ